ncbi:toprim domain-containing protein [Lactococcus lactis]|uniref:Toprim domain-containing protein n=1 Tax=Lactococcus lactis TaxID=1358 RepID=A0A9X4NIU5_9LACT|nr:toprim domain-containing protein [Lactococcus lactis]MDG4984557.1 toprim domain-containing protein [Lactococcus lactis]
MSNYKLVTIQPKFIAETVARTGSEELMDKATRSYVGLYDENTNWYIPLRANLGKKKPEGAFFETPFDTKNRHFVRPGLDFQKAIYVPIESIIEIDNTLPREQNILINERHDQIQSEFEKYVIEIEKYPSNSRDYLWSTVPLFPEGVEKIKRNIVKNVQPNYEEKRLEEIVKDFHEHGGELVNPEYININRMGAEYQEAYKRYKEQYPQEEIASIARRLGEMTGEEVSIEEMTQIREKIEKRKSENNRISTPAQVEKQDKNYTTAENKSVKDGRITDEMKKQAKNTSILDFATFYGIPLKKNSSDEYELVDHPKVKFSVRKNIFKDYDPASDAGGDVIDFAQYIDGIGFKQAVNKIIAVDGSGSLKTNYEVQPFVMPGIFEEGNQLNKILPYLVNERKLDVSTIKNLAQSGLIKQTRNGEVAFIWADGNKDTGMTLQGTKPFSYETKTFEVKDDDGQIQTGWTLSRKGSKEFLARGVVDSKALAIQESKNIQDNQRQYKKQIWSNSTTGHGFNFRSGQPEAEKGVMIFCESSIDLISYYDLHKHQFGKDTNVNYQSVEGVKDNILISSIERYEKRYSRLPDELVLAVDDDKGGKAFIEKIQGIKKTYGIKQIDDWGSKILKVDLKNATNGDGFIEKLEQLSDPESSKNPIIRDYRVINQIATLTFSSPNSKVAFEKLLNPPMKIQECLDKGTKIKIDPPFEGKDWNDAKKLSQQQTRGNVNKSNQVVPLPKKK